MKPLLERAERDGYRRRVKIKKGRYLLSLWGGLVHRRYFHDVKRFCIFIGYPRSGHTLIGSLLDAHPNAIIADEFNVLKYVEGGLSRRQIYYLLLRNSRRAATAGRKREGYSFHVPGQWQGRFQKLYVIGDKSAGVSAAHLTAHPSLLEQLQRTVHGEIKFIHVIRNPYDIISTMTLRSGKPLEVNIKNFLTYCARIETIKQRLNATDVYELTHEGFLINPKAGLRYLCDFFNLRAQENYLEACASIVFNSPHKSRLEAPWTTALIDTVKQNMARHEWLAGYNYDVP